MGDFLNLSSSTLFSPNNFMGEFRIQVFYYLIATLIILSGHNIFFMVFGLKKFFFVDHYRLFYNIVSVLCFGHQAYEILAS